MLQASFGKYEIGLNVAALLMLTCLATSALADISAEPAMLVFYNTGQSETIKLFAEGQPLSAHAITGWRLMVEARSYSHMLRITPTDAGLRVAPSDTVEVGSYTLVVTTPRGSVSVPVFTLLSDHLSGIESLAQRMNISIEEVRKQAGLSQRLGRDQIALGLLPVYYLGQRIQLAMSDVENRTFVWKVNGETALQGTGNHYFEYTAAETGALLIAYEERENDAIVAAATVLTEVAKEPAISHSVKVGARAHFEALPGFTEHVWLLDGKETATGAVMKHTFREPGRHLVTAISRNPAVPGPYAFRETHYDVEVRVLQE